MIHIDLDIERTGRAFRKAKREAHQATKKVKEEKDGNFSTSNVGRLLQENRLRLDLLRIPTNEFGNF